MTEFTDRKYELLVKPSTEKPKLDELENALGFHFAHFARGGGRRTKTYKRDAAGHYFLVATEPRALSQICELILKAGFVLSGGNFPCPKTPGKRVFVSPFQIAAQL